MPEPTRVYWHLCTLNGVTWHSADRARLVEWVWRKDKAQWPGEVNSMPPFLDRTGATYGYPVPDKDPTP